MPNPQGFAEVGAGAHVSRLTRGRGTSARGFTRCASSLPGAMVSASEVSGQSWWGDGCSRGTSCSESIDASRRVSTFGKEKRLAGRSRGHKESYREELRRVEILPFRMTHPCRLQKYLGTKGRPSSEHAVHPVAPFAILQFEARVVNKLGT